MPNVRFWGKADFMGGEYEIVIGPCAPTRTTLSSLTGSGTEYRVMPHPRRFDPTPPPPINQRRCPTCGAPMLLTMIEPTEQADDDQQTFECWACAYSEKIVVKFR